MSDDHEAGTTRVKQVVAGLVVLTIFALVGLHLAFGPRWYQGYQPKQPIPFSHKLHAGQYNMPCLYCHSQAEYAEFSPAPGLDVCMNCHQQVATDRPAIQQMKEAYDKNEAIAWVKVHVLPDFVHFNHRAHVSAGVACQTCHGPVETMEVVYQHEELTMGWCVQCHRDDNYLTEPREFLIDAKVELQGGPAPQWAQLIGQKQYHNADVSCSTCHY